VITFTVFGVAAPKGSAKAFIVKPKIGAPRAIITSDNKTLKGWERSIAAAAQTVADGKLLTGPLNVRLTFRLPRPATLPKKFQQHTKRPDLDKLARGALDALTHVLWKDDNQIVEIEARKQYADGDETPSVRFEITPLAEDGGEDLLAPASDTEIRSDVVREW